MNMSQSTRWRATVPFSSHWGRPCTVTSTLHRSHWPLGGRGPLLWAPPWAVQEEGERRKKKTKLMPRFQMSGLVNTPQTVVKDGNENGRVPECTAQWIHFPICIHGGGREGEPRGSSGGNCRGEHFWFRVVKQEPLKTSPSLNPSTPRWHNSLTHFLKAIIVAFNCIVVESGISVTQLCPPRSLSVCRCHSHRRQVLVWEDVCMFSWVSVCVCVCVCDGVAVTHLINLFAGVTVSRRWQRGADKGWFAFLQVTARCQPQSLHHL